MAHEDIPTNAELIDGTDTVLCQVCLLDGIRTEAIRRVIGTDGGGVCRGHVLPTLLAGHGVEPI